MNYIFSAVDNIITSTFTKSDEDKIIEKYKKISHIDIKYQPNIIEEIQKPKMEDLIRKFSENRCAMFIHHSIADDYQFQLLNEVKNGNYADVKNLLDNMSKHCGRDRGDYMGLVYKKMN
jgi:hypothetical protein